MKINPAATEYIMYSAVTDKVAASLRLSGNKSNNDTAISTPAAKADMAPNLAEYLMAKRPPNSVEKKVTIPNMKE